MKHIITLLLISLAMTGMGQENISKEPAYIIVYKHQYWDRGIIPTGNPPGAIETLKPQQ
ncbi:MAG TPA: hypothetical protein PK339_12545 [Flavitalea sp.]|nr:hypothetical protein [Flavitalea sp.]